MVFKFQDKELTIGSNIVINFMGRIKTVLEYKEMGLIVLLKPFETNNERNVYFVNNDGTIRWQIEPLVSPDDPDKKSMGYCGYTWIGFTENGELEVASFAPYNCFVNIETGALYNCFFEK